MSTLGNRAEADDPHHWEPMLQFMKTKQEALGLWLAIGVAIGTGLGVAFDNIGIGAAIGISLGVITGMAAGKKLP